MSITRSRRLSWLALALALTLVLLTFGATAAFASGKGGSQGDEHGKGDPTSVEATQPQGCQRSETALSMSSCKGEKGHSEAAAPTQVSSGSPASCQSPATVVQAPASTPTCKGGKTRFRSSLIPSMIGDPKFHEVAADPDTNWELRKGRVDVKVKGGGKGKMKVKIKGLAGDPLVTHVAASLFCGADSNTVPAFTSAPVPVIGGKAKIKAKFMLVGRCLAPIVLIHPGTAPTPVGGGDGPINQPTNTNVTATASSRRSTTVVLGPPPVMDLTHYIAVTGLTSSPSCGC